jgi:DNA-binding CsgD family transcriptional regulator
MLPRSVRARTHGMTGEAVLLERERETGVLSEALDRACGGDGVMVVLEGHAGIGKSRLLEATIRDARDRGLLCMRGRGAELERQMPFGVARQVLGRAVLELAPSERDRVMVGLAAGAGSVLAERYAPQAGDPVGQAASVDALYWLVHQLTRLGAEGPRARGALIAVDDAQWADASSLRLLVRLAVDLDELCVAVVVAVRSGEAPEDDLLMRLRGPGVRVLRPARLSDDGVAALVCRELGDRAEPEFCRACAEVTGGNPFLTYELVASLRAEGVAPTARTAAGLAGMVPDSVLHSVVLRLARLPATSRALAEAAAMLGPDAPLRVGAVVAELSDTDAGRAADALVAAGILRLGDPLQFAHPLIGEAVAAEMPQSARSRAHRRAADRLSADGASRERVGAHLRLTAPARDAWVVSALRTAAAESMARGEAVVSVRLLERALTEPPPVEERSSLLEQLAHAEAANGSPKALQRLEEARQVSDDPRQRARLLQAMSRMLFARGETRAAVRAAAQGRSELDPDDPLAGRILASQLAGMFFVPGMWAETDRLLSELEDGLQSGRWPSEPLLLAQLTTRRAVWLGEGADRVRPLAEAALAATPVAGDLFQGDPSIAAALIFVDEYELAERFLVRMAEHARRTGSPIYARMTAMWHGTMRYRQGWIADATADAEQALHLDGQEPSAETGWSAALLADARLELADLKGARAAIAAGMRGDHALLPHGFLLQARGELALAAGDADGALREFNAAGRHLRDRYSLDTPAVVPWRSGAAMALATLGDAAGGRELAEVELADARRSGTPHAMGRALRAAAAASKTTERIALLDEAVQILRPSGAQLEHVRALCDLGSALRHARKTGPAREHLERARELARRLGATATAQRAYRELRLSGARPQRGAEEDGATVLTPGELRVAKLAAEGHRNADIAQRLFVTPRTVESHLTQTYRKLGIRSRAGLANALSSEAKSRAAGSGDV